jgi:hypothetical protein
MKNVFSLLSTMHGEHQGMQLDMRVIGQRQSTKTGEYQIESRNSKGMVWSAGIPTD